MFLSLYALTMEEITFANVIIVMATATVFGVVFCGVYILTHLKTGYDRSFCTTILVMPIIISVVIIMVSDNLARAFSLAGVFALVRFRTNIADTRDIMFVFATVALGLSAGLGYIGFGIIISVFIATILYIIHLLKFDVEKESIARLKIVIPESLNYTHAFDVVFAKYLCNYQLTKVKTTDFGTTFELTYLINIKKDTNHKKFLDDLRVKNGNLNISMTSGYVNRVSEA
ncbi:MAG: DUF4956 domain-containing protein [Candidatus Izemoplasmatales bacterium]|jgi:small basic protein|nr:DUF4956 domain-containing protein [Candidatus Izemoplasmatales bacterium]MDD3865140.1 DUF4956 domain-containing protein [Candidatus Izemoplasmatales bacterium]